MPPPGDVTRQNKTIEQDKQSTTKELWIRLKLSPTVCADKAQDIYQVHRYTIYNIYTYFSEISRDHFGRDRDYITISTGSVLVGSGISI